MASELRVNTSTNRVGLGTITYTDTGPIISGITTGNNFKTGTTNVHSTGVELVNINTGGATATFGGAVTSTGNVNIAHGTGQAHYQITQTNGNTVKMGIVSGSDFEISGSSNNNIIFKRAGSTRLTVTSSGIDVSGTVTSTGDVSIADKIIHTGDTNTAIRFPAADQISFETAGTNRLKIHNYDSNNNVEVDASAHLSLADNGSNGRFIYIGDGDASSTGYMHLQPGGGSQGFGGGIRLYSHANSTNAGGVYIGKSLASSGAIIFGNGGMSPSNEYARIDSNGRIGLGIANPGDYFSSYNRVVMGRTNDTGGMTIVSATTSGGYITFADGTSGNAAYRGQIAYQHSGDYMTFGTDGGVERLRIDSSGRFIFRGDSTGGNSGLGGFGTHTWTPKVQVLHDQGQVIIRDGDEVWGGALHLAKCRGTYASPTAAASGDRAGGLYYHAHDGTDFLNYVAGIESYLDNGVGSNDTPGRLVFSTTADGANSLTERMRITSTGRIGMSQSSPDAATLHIGNSVATTGSNVAFQVGTISGQNRYLTIHHFGNQQNFHSLKMRVNDNGLIAMLDMGNPYGSQNHGTKIKFSGYQDNECASIEVVNTANNNANAAEMRFKTGGTTEGMRINKTGVVMINSQTDTDISDVTKFKVGGVFRHKTRSSAEIDHGFYAMSTGSGSYSGGYFHMKTDLATNSSAMFLITVRGYAYGQGKVVFCQTCGYCYSSTNTIINVQNKSWDGTTEVTTYKTSDGYVAIRFTPGGWSSYYMGFWVDISQQNPAKSGLNHKVTASAIDSSSTYYA